MSALLSTMTGLFMPIVTALSSGCAVTNISGTSVASSTRATSFSAKCSRGELALVDPHRRAHELQANRALVDQPRHRLEHRVEALEPPQRHERALVGWMLPGPRADARQRHAGSCGWSAWLVRRLGHAPNSDTSVAVWRGSPGQICREGAREQRIHPGLPRRMRSGRRPPRRRLQGPSALVLAEEERTCPRPPHPSYGGVPIAEVTSDQREVLQVVISEPLLPGQVLAPVLRRQMGRPVVLPNDPGHRVEEVRNPEQRAAPAEDRHVAEWAWQLCIEYPDEPHGALAWRT